MSPCNRRTLEHERQQNDAAVLRTGFNPEVGLASVAHGLRSRFEQLLRKGVLIETLLSVEDQKQDYGVDRWNEGFQRVDDRQFRRVLAVFPDFARFQQLFCRREDFIGPRSGRVVRSRTLSLRPCLVSVDRIPDKFVEDLRFCDFSGDKGNPLARRAKKKEIIPRLKLLFEAAVPLQHGHHRIHVIEQPSSELQRQYRGVPGPDTRTLGKLLYTRESGNGEEHERMAQLFDVYGARRKTMHQSQGYEREISLLTNMEYELGLLVRRLDTAWSPTKGTPERQELSSEAKRLLQGFEHDLRLCKNLPKVEAHDLLDRCAELRDSRGKENISAAMSQMVATRNRLEKRFNEMYPKGGFNQEDRLALHHAIREHEKAMRSARTMLEQGTPAFLQLSSQWSGTSAAGNAEVEGASVERAMGLRSNPIRDIRLEPFRTYAQCMQQQYGTLRGALRRRDRTASLDAIVSAHVIGKFQAIRTCFEHMKDFSVEREHDPLGRIARFALELREQFSTFQIVPEHRVPALVQPFEFMERALVALEKSVKRFAGQHLTPSRRAELCSIIKEYLDAYDLEAMVRSRPGE